MNKKAVATYISLVLVLAVVSVLSVIIYGWVGSSTKFKLTKAGNENSRNLRCMNVEFVVKKTIYKLPINSDGWISIDLENKNTVKIYKFILLVYKGDGDMFTIPISQPLGPLELKTINITKDDSSYLQKGENYTIMKLELVPLLRDEIGEYPCRISSYPIFPREIMFYR